jgi:hypothetical protein
MGKRYALNWPHLTSVTDTSIDCVRNHKEEVYKNGKFNESRNDEEKEFLRKQISQKKKLLFFFFLFCLYKIKIEPC